MNMDCPPDFILPVRTTPENAPPIVPGSENIIYADKKLYEETDRHALSVNKRHYASFRELMWHLVYRRELSQLNRARVLFRWLASPKIAKVTFDSMNSEEERFTACSPYSSDTGSFALLFQYLCSYSELYCDIISGFAKGSTYMPGDTVKEKEPNHAWNSVCIDTRWYLVDLCWAVCNGNSPTCEIHDNGTLHEFDDYFFLMDPNRAIYTHYPYDNNWQLLPNPMVITQFENLPLIRHSFFESGLQFNGSPDGVKRTTNGLLKISHLYHSVSEFSYSMKFFKNETSMDIIGNAMVNSFAILEVQDSEVIVYLRYPHIGTYYLTIYSKVINTFKDLETEQFKLAVRYRIECGEPCLPSTTGTIVGQWDYGIGPCWPLLYHFKIVPITFSKGIIPITADPPYTLEIIFELKRPCRQLLSKVRSPFLLNEVNDVTEMSYDESFIIRESLSLRDYIVAISLPTYGEYVYELYALDPNEGENFILVCQYLLDYKDSSVNLITASTVYECEDLPISALPDPYIYAKPDSTLVFEGIPINKFTTPRATPVPPAKSPDELDGDTQKVGEKSQSSVDQLMWDLIYNRDLQVDQDRIRAIFVWLCTKNLNTLNFIAPKKNSPEELLMKMKSGQTSYADAFSLLCRCVNIRCTTVEGIAKGRYFRSGEQLTTVNHPNLLHTWNAAFLNGQWHLFDCLWASRRVNVPKSDNNSNSNGAYDYTLDDFYFMCPPENMRLTHYPHDEQWQLMPDPISLENFLLIPPLKSKFFLYNLTLKSHPNGYIEAEKSLEIEVGTPPELFDQLSFSFVFRKEDNFENLDNYGFLYLSKDGSPTVIFNFKLPDSGYFSIILLVRHISEGNSDSFVEYRLKATGDTELKPYPHLSLTQFYGTSHAARAGNLQHNLGNDFIICNIKRSLLGIFWRTDKKLPYLVGALRSLNHPENDLEKYVTQRQTVSGDGEDKLEVRFQFFFPSTGEFTLQVFMISDTDACKFVIAAQYLVHVVEATDEEPSIGNIPGVVVGPTQYFADLCLKTSSHHDSLIEMSSTIDQTTEQGLPWADSDLCIEIATPNIEIGASNFPICLVPQLSVYDPKNPSLDTTFNQNILQQIDNGIIKFLVRIPSSGTFKFHIFGLTLPTTADSLPLLYTYLIKAPTRSVPFLGESEGPFPRQGHKWREGGLLISPINGNLYTSTDHPTTLNFSLQLYRAKDVVLVVDDIVTHMTVTQTDANTIDTWEAELDLPRENNKKIIICGRWSNISSHYATLVQYTVKIR